MPDIGLIPGRSFVGRIVECGWEVREDVLRKGDWVAGLLNIKKCGGLTEFIVVDRHRVHRVPHPKLLNRDTYTDAPSSLVFSSPPASPTSSVPVPHYSLTIEELALLPLCGVPAYRAVRTFTYAFSSMRDNLSSGSIKRTPSERTQHGPIRSDSYGHQNSAIHGGKIPHLNLIDHENGRRRRALVLRGHDGIGAMALQMLVHRGWRVCVHVPFIASPPNVPTAQAVADRFMEEIEERIRNWGAEEVIFDDGEILGVDEGRGAIVRVIDGLTKDGDAFDVVLDTIGGKEVREAAERLLRSPGRRTGVDDNDVGRNRNGKSGARGGMGQFTTIVGDNPERVIPSAGDMFRAGLRSLKFGTGSAGVAAPSSDKGSSENVHLRNADNKGSKVGYAWINISQDLDYEGKDVGDTIGSLVELAMEYGIKPWVGAEYAPVKRVGEENEDLRSGEVGITAGSGFDHWEGRRIVSFEKAPDIFIDSGPLNSGGTAVVKIAT
ncbi:hypothetical protein AGABI2DRAFT_202145 [Agaricus bisporus var. bisporus H97]|uniref:hypothetical protein n=1 Tax=Agaricus bisporus var. bisporus (strain H97 / ATCC MYA-4626 / FGSC 10389) TaxID=936046 RepID=UPI00029F79CB|nr:hypothetical protein AGABI2DRAFT_202145 [Agaricus bisporus var. bisporus H97]EKV47904.1 hypothetical protein AGABI2DRAFT_202145 [Agaricus bisporus var. bisporus H97]